MKPTTKFTCILTDDFVLKTNRIQLCLLAFRSYFCFIRVSLIYSFIHLFCYRTICNFNIYILYIHVPFYHYASMPAVNQWFAQRTHISSCYCLHLYCSAFCILKDCNFTQKKGWHTYRHSWAEAVNEASCYLLTYIYVFEDEICNFNLQKLKTYNFFQITQTILGTTVPKLHLFVLISIFNAFCMLNPSMIMKILISTKKMQIASEKSDLSSFLNTCMKMVKCFEDEGYLTIVFWLGTRLKLTLPKMKDYHLCKI